VSTLLKVTGIRKLISFYRYIYFNGPGVTKFSGIGLILIVGLTHMYVFPEHFEAASYIGMSFATLFAGTLLSALGILRGSRWGWTLGSVICSFAFVAYIISRTLGLPGFGEAIGDWATPAGTMAEVFEAGYLGLHFSVITGMNVASPDRRDWHD
jgi:hypothetical protein